jgi:hypothetical protein
MYSVACVGHALASLDSVFLSHVNQAVSRGLIRKSEFSHLALGFFMVLHFGKIIAITDVLERKL